MRKSTNFENNQAKKQLALLQNLEVFDGAEAGGWCLVFDFKTKKKFWRTSQKVIKYPENTKNLFRGIRKSALAYFELNDIEWWHQSEEHYFPNGHVLSSQIHCLNHLFAIRADYDAVLKVIQTILPEITEILPSPIDEQFCVMEEYPYKTPSYISFEFTYNNKLYLNERCNKRGANCTSVDAFIYAKDQEGKHVLIPIEWKYTEHYEKTDKNRVDDETIEKRYRHLAELTDSNLNGWNDVYYWDPAYELARQTLLMEQIKREKPFDADRIEHLLICPKGNVEMMQDAEAFKITLKDSTKFHIIDPQKLLEPIRAQHKNIVRYLQTRYWDMNTL